MEIDIKTKEFLDALIEQKGLDKNMSYSQVLNNINREFKFRNKIINKSQEKINDLKLFLQSNIPFNKDGNPNNFDYLLEFSDDLSIDNMDVWELEIDLGYDVNLTLLKNIYDLKLYFYLDVIIESDVNRLILKLRISEDKLNMLRGLV